MTNAITVTHLWNSAPHNAFTDLIEFNGTLFCAFREGEQHAGGQNGSIRILKSQDGLSWSPVAQIVKEGIDLRDPKFSLMSGGHLMLNMGGSRFHDEEYLGRSPHVAFSDDGIHWTTPHDLQMPDEWIWQVIWHQEIGYGASYRFTDSKDFEQPWILTLFKTQNGLQYEPITQLGVPDYPSETTLRMLPDNTMIALARRDGSAWIGTANPPYDTWAWTETNTRLGGPNFLILDNGEMWAAGRITTRKDEDIHTQTAVGQMTLTSFTPSIILPSSGDTGYPGMVFLDRVLLVSYYSSHEGKSSIYFARIPIHH